MKIREVISIAKHKMSAKKFIPSLNGIPEEETNSGRCSSSQTNKQRTQGSVQGSTARSKRSQRCTGCPGCTEYQQSVPATLPVNVQSTPGESKVRAWLQDVKPPDASPWNKDVDDDRRNFQENARVFSRNLNYLREISGFDETVNGVVLSCNDNKSATSWKNNPPMLKTFQNIARSETYKNDDGLSVTQRSTKSMFEESNYDRYRQMWRGNLPMDLTANNPINVKVRKAIENSFIKQMEENAAVMENKESGKRTAPRRSKKVRAPPIPNKKLPDMINELPNTKRIMDAVIREMVDVKAIEHHEKPHKIVDYEVDSLERTKSSSAKSASPDSAKHSSPTLSVALPMDEELTMQNAVINAQTGKMTMSKIKNDAAMPTPESTVQRPNNCYSLVSEVYVNDGYASPAESDDSGPEIQYEPENPGHLTIKVQDCPANYIKQDESEYEPDTLDRKPMKLKVNGDVNYERNIVQEVYVDSLERPHILLKSKSSFRNDSANCDHNYNSLREIFEARLKCTANNTTVESLDKCKNLLNNNNNNNKEDSSVYLTPEARQARRQRKPQNQPDVVPLPVEEIYQRPKPPRRVEQQPLKAESPKNARDRSYVEAGDESPTDTSVDPPVTSPVNVTVGAPFNVNNNNNNDSSSAVHASVPNKHHQTVSDNKFKLPRLARTIKAVDSCGNKGNSVSGTFRAHLGKIEDSGYLSSSDSNNSQKKLLKHETSSSVSETDDTESTCDGISESGAESIGTDSVFFGNFRGQHFQRSVMLNSERVLQHPRVVSLY